MEISKSQINKLGVNIRRKLRAFEKLEDSDILNLQEYRTSFKEDLAPVFSILSKIVKQERRDTIISYRIKRIESILSKIKREPTMALGNMGDIAGCRLIIYSESNLFKVLQSIEKKFIVKFTNDYISKPKEDGYTGFHFYVESPRNKNKLVEIQVRTIQTHRWASLVEIVDMIYGLKLKEGEKNDKLEHFLKLLAIDKDLLNISQKAEIIRIDSELGIYNKLLAVFLNNNLSIRKDWVKLRESGDNNYFIIEVDSSNKSNIISFKDYEEAEKIYFKMFLNNTESNFVLTHIEKPTFNRICTAYSSYVLTRHNYLDDWSSFVRDLISEDLKNGQYKKLSEVEEFIKRNLKDRLSILTSEIAYLNEEINNVPESENLTEFQWMTEWNEEISERFKNVEDLKNEVNIFLKKYKPSNLKRTINKFLRK